jgi:hypothetical protein
MRAALRLLVLVAASTGGCHRPPHARIAVRRLDGPRPPQAEVRCLVDGLGAHPTYQWKLSPGLRGVGWNVPTDEPWLLVQLQGDSAPPGGSWAECDAADDAGRAARAAVSLFAPVIGSWPRTLVGRAGELVTVRGSGFGPARGDDDQLYFVGPRRAPFPADFACKGASWSDAAVSACVPAGGLGAGAWTLRVQASGALGLAPGDTTVGTPGVAR